MNTNQVSYALIEADAYVLTFSDGQYLTRRALLRFRRPKMCFEEAPAADPGRHTARAGPEDPSLVRSS
ncbi:hypothetical protein [Flindersiella endophytica]